MKKCCKTCSRLDSITVKRMDSNGILQPVKIHVCSDKKIPIDHPKTSGNVCSHWEGEE